MFSIQCSMGFTSSYHSCFAILARRSGCLRLRATICDFLLCTSHQRYSTSCPTSQCIRLLFGRYGTYRCLKVANWACQQSLQQVACKYLESSWGGSAQALTVQRHRLRHLPSNLGHTTPLQRRFFLYEATRHHLCPCRARMRNYLQLSVRTSSSLSPLDRCPSIQQRRV